MTFLKRHMKLPKLALALSISMLMAIPTTAGAQELKTAPSVDGDHITLGDLFDNAGAVSDVVIANSPAPGEKLFLSIRDIQRAAQANGFTWEQKVNRSTITINRSGIAISKNDLARLLKDALAFEKSGTNFAVYLQGQNKPLYIPTSSATTEIEVESINLDHRTGRFVSYLTLPVTTSALRRVEVRGKVEDLVSIPVLNHTMIPSDLITAKDILWLDVPARTITQNTVQSTEVLLEMEPKRPLRAKTALRISDVRRPIVVKKGSIVTLTVNIGNLKMSAQGRALENAGKGDLVRVMNLDSHKTIEGIVTRSGRVVVLNRKSSSLLAENN